MKNTYPKISICDNCNSLFIKYSYTIFCKNECRKEYLRKEKYKKKVNHKQIEIFELLPVNEVFKPVERNCIVCNKDISDKRKNAKYCSKKCKSKELQEHREHEKNIM